MQDTGVTDPMGGMLAMEAQGVMLRALGLGAASRQVTAALEHAFLALVPRLDPGAVIEVGAHEAGFSKRMRRRLPAVPAIAFEANAEVHRRYAPGLAAAGVDYRNQAVSDRPGEVTFRVPRRPGGEPLARMGSLLAPFGGQAAEEMRVQAVTLDSLGVQRAALWIDVEGAVGQIIAGGAATLASAVAVYVELEEERRWPGQMVAREALSAFARFGLVPVLRDQQRRWQYNAVLLRDELVHRALPGIEDRFFATLRELAGIPGPQAAERPGETG
jgi:FkbM family methyltransferase